MRHLLTRDGLYLANGTVLLTHQIDAAYWHEWDLFGLPGGAPLFMLTNLPIVFLVLYGSRALALGRTSGVLLSWALVAAGLLAVGLHSFFLLRGHEEFGVPVSLGLLAATLLLSLAQAVLLGRSTRSPGSAAPSALPAAARAPR